MNKTMFVRKALNIETVKTEYLRVEKRFNDPITVAWVSRLDDIFTVDKVVELSSKAFDKFADNLLVDQAFIKKNRNLMHVDVHGVWHCLLVKGEGHDEAILVEAEGYDYARYAAYIPNCEGIKYVD